ncbi:hypothetical protein RchiOBHm_Chr6g0248861 [Rosa chinensis]|uniref:Uncharacterized protein n=1 Tax=Rosa chinensis TaxID=74649 RepID=A0A2P6PK51_ROSCH|nr:hypothetical protein RchiOBHm_Chr6g0248861 [Rosa chinensis]
MNLTVLVCCRSFLSFAGTIGIGLCRLLAGSGSRPVACSESAWWRLAVVGGRALGPSARPWEVGGGGFPSFSATGIRQCSRHIRTPATLFWGLDRSARGWSSVLGGAATPCVGVLRSPVLLFWVADGARRRGAAGVQPRSGPGSWFGLGVWAGSGVGPVALLGFFCCCFLYLGFVPFWSSFAFIWFYFLLIRQGTRRRSLR